VGERVAGAAALRLRALLVGGRRRRRAADNETIILYALLVQAGRAGAGGRSAWSGE